MNYSRGIGCRTDRKIMSNSPDIVFMNYKRNICLVIEMSVPPDNNILVKEYYKISK